MNRPYDNTALVAPSPRRIRETCILRHAANTHRTEKQVTGLQTQDNEFFEEYKRLEKLCSEIYGVPNGVSAYIADMEGKAAQGRYRIPLWETDYKTLKHLRWVRNELAHNTYTYVFSEPLDVRQAQDFRQRILTEQDPLTRLQRVNAARRSQQRPRQVQPPYFAPAPPRQETPAPPRQVTPAPSLAQPPARKGRRGVAFVFILLGIVLLYAAIRLYLTGG